MATYTRENLIANGYGIYAGHVLRGALEGNATETFDDAAVTELVASWLSTPTPPDASDVRSIVLAVGEIPEDGDIVQRIAGAWVSQAAPAGADNYLGPWNASTNTPTLANGTGTAGDYYLVSVGGTRNLGGGNVTYGVGDLLVYSPAGLWEDFPVTVAAPDASTTVKGISKLSVAPASPTSPIALGANDPAVTNARTPTAHASSHAPGGSDPLTTADLPASVVSGSRGGSSGGAAPSASKMPVSDGSGGWAWSTPSGGGSTAFFIDGGNSTSTYAANIDGGASA